MPDPIKQLPFLRTSKLLMEATKAGMGREAAHKILNAASANAKSGPFSSLDEHPLVVELSNSKDFLLDKAAILQAIQAKPLWGLAEAQTEEFVAMSRKFLKEQK